MYGVLTGYMQVWAATGKQRETAAAAAKHGALCSGDWQPVQILISIVIQSRFTNSKELAERDNRGGIYQNWCTPKKWRSYYKIHCLSNTLILISFDKSPPITLILYKLEW